MMSIETSHSAVAEVATCSYLCRMRAVGIKSLKNRLSEYIRLVRAGETVLVTDRDQVVAELVPPQTERAGNLSDVLLAEAVRKGWVTAPLGEAGELPTCPRVAPLADLLGELRDDRDSR